MKLYNIKTEFVHTHTHTVTMEGGVGGTTDATFGGGDGLYGRYVVVIYDGGQATGDEAGMCPHLWGGMSKRALGWWWKLYWDDIINEDKNSNATDQRWPRDSFYTCYFSLWSLIFIPYFEER